FDIDQKRYHFKVDTGGSHANVRLMRFRLDPTVLPADRAQFLGIEYLTPDGQKVVAKKAFQDAQAAGVEVMPMPEIGKAYDFTLTAMDGSKLRAADLRGKVVLIDCWATWCTPCMAKMPKLKELYAKYHAAGLEIVGVNWDKDAAKAEEARKRLEL